MLHHIILYCIISLVSTSDGPWNQNVRSLWLLLGPYDSRLNPVTHLDDPHARRVKIVRDRVHVLRRGSGHIFARDPSRERLSYATVFVTVIMPVVPWHLGASRLHLCCQGIQRDQSAYADTSYASYNQNKH